MSRRAFEDETPAEGPWLYFARTDALADDPRALALLDDEERARHERFLFEHSKREFRAAHAMLRVVLATHVRASPASLRFVRNEHGRPSLDPSHAAEHVRFNLSHTDGMLCVLVALHLEVGVDVEDALRPRQTVAVADRFFAPSEVAALRSLPESAQIARFFAYWTLKESYIKARGMGLSLPLDGFAFEFEPEPSLDEPASSSSPRVMNDRVTLRCEPIVHDRGDRWRFARVRLSERHVAAVAVEGSPHEPLALSLIELKTLASPHGPQRERTPS
jgi:4'-phosphopantetheinyl transferase